MLTVAITGSKGKVGKALIPQLEKHYKIISVDLPEVDVLNAKQLREALKGVDVVIHLAGVFGDAADKKEGWLSPYQDPTNKELFIRTLSAAEEVGVKLFIHASSIHAEDSFGYMRGQGKEKLVARPRVFTTPKPSSGYGQSKRDQEAILEAGASRFEHGAVSIRLGGVTSTGLPMMQHADALILEHEHKVWLSHDDLGSLVLKIIAQHKTPTYDVVYAVSNNDGRFHDISNQYDWTPLANSSDYIH